MSQEELITRLLSDLSLLKLPTNEVDIYIRPFSKTYYGRYFPVYNDEETKPKIYLYPLLQTVIHEFCHHLQYTSGSFVRNRGVMHNAEFWKLYNHYINRAKQYSMIGGEVCETV